MRIARRQHVGELRVEFGHARFEFDDLVSERVVVGGQFACGRQIVASGLQLAMGGDNRGQSGESATRLACLVGIAVQLGIRQSLLELGVLGEQHVNRLYRLRHHTPPSPSPRSPGPSGAYWPQTRTDARPALLHSSGVGQAAIYRLIQPCRLRPCAFRNASRSVQPGRRCPESSACRCRTVALRADLDDDATAFFGAAGLERVTASADHRGLRVGGMNVSFHDVLFDLVEHRLCQVSHSSPKQRGTGRHSRRTGDGET